MSRTVRLCLILGLTLTTARTALAQELTLESLRCMDRCALDDLFRGGRAVAPPVGYARGHILYFSECYYRCRVAVRPFPPDVGPVRWW